MAQWPIPNPSLERARLRNPWAPGYAAAAAEALSLATLWMMLSFVGGLVGIGLAALGHAGPRPIALITSVGAAIPLFGGLGTLIEASRYSFLSAAVLRRRRAAARHRQLSEEHRRWPFVSGDVSVLFQVLVTAAFAVALARGGTP
ncbi:MAG: hypothetical protein ACRDNK_02875 [Solirubrobacteraceae bacterium]